MEASPDPRTDGELLIATSSDPEAFAIFYRRHLWGVLRFFRLRVGNVEVAFDLTAETFAAALEASPRYELRAEPTRGWLYGIAWSRLQEAQHRGRAQDAGRRAMGMAQVQLTEAGLARLGALASERALALPGDRRQAVQARLLDERPRHETRPELRCSDSIVRAGASPARQTMRAAIEAGADG